MSRSIAQEEMKKSSKSEREARAAVTTKPISRYSNGKNIIHTKFSGISGNPTEHIQDALESVDAHRSVQKSGRQLARALASNPLSNLIEDPVQEIKDEANQVAEAAKFAANLVTKGSADIKEPSQKTERVRKAAQQHADDVQSYVRKGIDRLKKKFKKLFNHPTWYGKYPKLVTTNLNWGVRKERALFPVAVGARIEVALLTPMKNGAVSQAFRDQINALFARLRGSNSGAFNYTPEDLGAYIECARGIYALHANLERDLKMMNNVDPYIAKTPDVLLTTAGYNAAGISNMRAEYANYSATLNRLKDMIEASIPLPPDMSVFERTLYVSRAIIEEGKGPKSSLYVYTLSSILVPSGNNNNTLQIQPVSNTSFAVRLATLENALSAFWTYWNTTYADQTFNKIAGDIIKAYGERGFSKILRYTELQDKAETVYDEYLLHQIQNSNPVCDKSSFRYPSNTPSALFAQVYYTDITVTGDNSHTFPIDNLMGVSGRTTPGRDVIVNTDKQDITGLEAISLTRNITLYKAGSLDTSAYNTTFGVVVTDSSSDIITAITATYFRPDNGNLDDVRIAARGKSAFPILEYSMWGQIDYMPGLQMFDDSNDNGYYDILLDIDTYAYYSKNQTQAFNDAAVVSLYSTVGINDQVNFRAVKR